MRLRRRRYDRDQLIRIRTRVERAHREVQAAQRLAYQEHGRAAPSGVCYALNRAESTLMKLLVHALPHREEP